MPMLSTKKTFNEVFPDVELEESTYMLQNFDKRLIKTDWIFQMLPEMERPQVQGEI